METTTASNKKIKRLQSGGIPRSPRLSRSSNGRSIVSQPEVSLNSPSSPSLSETRPSSASLPVVRPFGSRPASPQKPITRTTRSATTSPRPSIHRSRSTSTSKSRAPTKEKDDEQNYTNIPLSKAHHSSPQRRLSFESRSDQKNTLTSQTNLAKLFRSTSHNNVKGGTVRSSLPGSPSAWALSSGRLSPGPPLAPDSPKVKGVSSVLKYFNKPKKASFAQEEEFHEYKIMSSRLLQWRFANAKAEAAAAKVKIKAEGKMFGVWLKLYKMRYAMAEKRMKVERLKQKIKLLEIISPQIELLKDWEKIEKKNCEAVGRVTRKLSAYSTKLPLVNGAMAELVSLFDAMKLALEVMDNIEDTIINFQFQAERASNMLREIIAIVEHSMECFCELEKEIESVMSLEAREESLVVHLIQANTNQEENQRNCKHHLMRSSRTSRNKHTRLFSSMYFNVS